MPRTKLVTDRTLLEAALEGLELQKKRIEEQIREVRARLGTGRRGGASQASETPPRRGRGGRRVLSAEARRRIAEAQKKRWAAFHRKAARKSPSGSSE